MIFGSEAVCATCPVALLCMRGSGFPDTIVKVCVDCKVVQLIGVASHNENNVVTSLAGCPKYKAKHKGSFTSAINRRIKQHKLQRRRFSFQHIPEIMIGNPIEWVETLCESCATDLINDVHELIFQDWGEARLGGYGE